MSNRLTVVEHVYHQREGTAVVEDVPTRFERILASDEERYKRSTKAGEQWQPLDTGWVSDPSCLVIRNDETDTVKVLEIKPAGQRSDRQPWLVHAGQSMRGCPGGKLLIRCRAGEARFTVVAIPG